MSNNSWLPANPLEWLCEVLALLIVLFCVAFPLIHWPDIPDRIPTHFNLQGEPDAWGSKDSLWLISGLTVAGFAVLKFVQRNTRFVNVPMQVDRDNPAVQALLRQMMVTLTPLILANGPIIIWRQVFLAVGRPDMTANWLLPAWLAAVFMHLGSYLLRLNRIARP